MTIQLGNYRIEAHATYRKPARANRLRALPRRSQAPLLAQAALAALASAAVAQALYVLAGVVL